MRARMDQRARGSWWRAVKSAHVGCRQRNSVLGIFTDASAVHGRKVKVHVTVAKLHVLWSVRVRLNRMRQPWKLVRVDAKASERLPLSSLTERTPPTTPPTSTTHISIATDRTHISERVIHLHGPVCAHRSVLIPRAARLLPGATTARPPCSP